MFFLFQTVAAQGPRPGGGLLANAARRGAQEGRVSQSQAEQAVRHANASRQDAQVQPRYQPQQNQVLQNQVRSIPFERGQRVEQQPNAFESQSPCGAGGCGGCNGCRSFSKEDVQSFIEFSNQNPQLFIEEGARSAQKDEQTTSFKGQNAMINLDFLRRLHEERERLKEMLKYRREDHTQKIFPVGEDTSAPKKGETRDSHAESFSNTLMAAFETPKTCLATRAEDDRALIHTPTRQEQENRTVMLSKPPLKKSEWATVENVLAPKLAQKQTETPLIVPMTLPVSNTPMPFAGKIRFRTKEFSKSSKKTEKTQPLSQKQQKKGRTDPTRKSRESMPTATRPSRKKQVGIRKTNDLEPTGSLKKTKKTSASGQSKVETRQPRKSAVSPKMTQKAKPRPVERGVAGRKQSTAKKRPDALSGNPLPKIRKKQRQRKQLDSVPQKEPTRQKGKPAGVPKRKFLKNARKVAAILRHVAFSKPAPTTRRERKNGKRTQPDQKLGLLSERRLQKKAA